MTRPMVFSSGQTCVYRDEIRGRARNPASGFATSAGPSESNSSSSVGSMLAERPASGSEFAWPF